MSNEINATSRLRPSRAHIVRVVGLVVPGITYENGRIDDAWELRDRRGNIVVVVELGPSEHEFDVWEATVAAMRTDDCRLLAIVTAGAIALLGDGLLYDGDKFLGCGTLSPGKRTYWLAQGVPHSEYRTGVRASGPTRTR